MIYNTTSEHDPRLYNPIEPDILNLVCLLLQNKNYSEICSVHWYAFFKTLLSFDMNEYKCSSVLLLNIRYEQTEISDYQLDCLFL